MVFALLISLIKIIVVFIGMVLTPIGFWLRFILKEFRYTDKIVGFAETNNWGILKLSNDIWENYATLKSAKIVVEDLKNFARKFKQRTWAKNILAGLFSPITILFLIIKYVVTVLFEIVFRLFHASFMVISLFITLIYMVFRLVLTPLTKLLVTVFNFGYSHVERIYPALLKSSLANSYTIVGSVAVLFFITIYFIAPQLGSELIPEVHQGEFYVEMTLQIGLCINNTCNIIHLIF